MKLKQPERRRYVRIEVPLKIQLTSGKRVEKVVTKNISPVGMRFEVSGKLDEGKQLKLALSLSASKQPIRMKGKVAWQTKTSLEDNAPYDCGVEIVDIEDKDKNAFLKYVLDTLYSSPEYMPREQ
jgi:c-di-GMP-binding flagellar brake protein YcgR